MTVKNCYILDNSRGFVFYGPLDESLVGTTGYNFYEVATTKKHRPHKIINGQAVVDFQKEYDDKVEYQKKAFREFRDEILKQIQYATILEKTDTVTALTTQLNNELTAYETRVNAITLETE